MSWSAGEAHILQCWESTGVRNDIHFVAWFARKGEHKKVLRSELWSGPGSGKACMRLLVGCCNSLSIFHFAVQPRTIVVSANL